LRFPGRRIAFWEAVGIARGYSCHLTADLPTRAAHTFLARIRSGRSRSNWEPNFDHAPLFSSLFTRWLSMMQPRLMAKQRPPWLWAPRKRSAECVTRFDISVGKGAARPMRRAYPSISGKPTTRSPSSGQLASGRVPRQICAPRRRWLALAFGRESDDRFLW
jgi:hypothetical protein